MKYEHFFVWEVASAVKYHIPVAAPIKQGAQVYYKLSSEQLAECDAQRDAAPSHSSEDVSNWIVCLVAFVFFSFCQLSLVSWAFFVGEVSIPGEVFRLSISKVSLELWLGKEDFGRSSQSGEAGFVATCSGHGRQGADLIELLLWHGHVRDSYVNDQSRSYNHLQEAVQDQQLVHAGNQ